MNGSPRRLVLLGHPVGHSLSPLIQNAALRAAGLPMQYEALDVPPERLDTVVDELIAEEAAGNVTLPHKMRVAARCTSVSEPARRAGAVNVFVASGGRLTGDNTDIPAFATTAREVLGGPPAGLRIALLGAGGAAAAVLAAAEAWPDCEVVLHNRTPRRGEALAERFPVVRALARSAEEAVHGADLVVNATSLGLRDADAAPVPLACLASGAAIIDLVYRPGGTRWVRSALAAGHRAVDGTAMLLEQGALAFERWFGRPAPRAVMREALARQETRGS